MANILGLLNDRIRRLAPREIKAQHARLGLSAKDFGFWSASQR
jgi:hypothetical protein